MNAPTTRTASLYPTAEFGAVGCDNADYLIIAITPKTGVEPMRFRVSRDGAELLAAEIVGLLTEQVSS